MFQTMNNPKAAYEKVGLDVSVEVASPYKLILMLFDGAILAVTQATAHSRNGDKMAMSEAIFKASTIISQGLRDSLDQKAGGDLAVRLSALYDYAGVQLQFANLHGDIAILDEVSGLLKELRSAWEEIADDPDVFSSSKGAG